MPEVVVTACRAIIVVLASFFEDVKRPKAIFIKRDHKRASFLAGNASVGWLAGLYDTILL